LNSRKSQPTRGSFGVGRDAPMRENHHTSVANIRRILEGWNRQKEGETVIGVSIAKAIEGIHAKGIPFDLYTD
jgi:hypothetical protein